MNRYILQENIALRGWLNRPYNYTKGKHSAPVQISKVQFARLSDCEEVALLPDDELTAELLGMGLTRATSEGEKAADWQKYHFYPHIYFHSIELEITERCNYNCRHCFNAGSIGVPRNELSAEDAKRILSEASEEGVTNVVLTGGEPLLHPDFFEIIDEIQKCGMTLLAINTNGYFINEKLLDRLSLLEPRPVMKISFDGLGFHDWMRGVPGAEEKTVRAIKLCKERGFIVMIQMNLNKRNLDVMNSSVDFLNELGVNRVRVIRTTEAPRWIEQAGNDCLSWEEYYDAALEITKYYVSKPRNFSIDFWEYLFVDERKKSFRAEKIQFRDAEAHPWIFSCQGRIDLCANGELYPCMQMSGGLKEAGVCLADTKKEALEKLLTDSLYLKFVSNTVGDKKKGNERCANCPFFKYCGGGCPALSLILHGSYNAPDDSSCIFFRDDYYKKIREILPGYTDKAPMPDIDSSYLKDFDYDIKELIKLDFSQFKG